MVPPPSPLRLDCSSCGWSVIVGPTEMQSWVSRAGMLRRNEHPSEAEVRELLPVAAAKLACPDCGVQGLRAGHAADDRDAWPADRRCQSCGQVIPPERLEVFPSAELCIACQRRVDERRPQATDEFCERCGWPVVMRLSSGRGITRNVMACSNPACKARG
jgi:predicted RNA-binding Zn-ribbon protein involved in translation (DUF1610 family)